MKTFGIEVRFDGTDFAGWQVQPGRRTVQGEIEDALGRLFGGPVRLRGAGRTDTGVHALRAVAAFDVRTEYDGATVFRALGALLPPEILLLRALPAPDGFDPRRSAHSRTYLYRILPGRDPFRRRYVWERRRPPDMEPMVRAAALLTGERDHTSFAASTRKGMENTVRIDGAWWEREGDEIRFTVTANRLLSSRMVFSAGVVAFQLWLFFPLSRRTLSRSAARAPGVAGRAAVSRNTAIAACFADVIRSTLLWAAPDGRTRTATPIVPRGGGTHNAPRRVYRGPVGAQTSLACDARLAHHRARRRYRIGSDDTGAH